MTTDTRPRVDLNPIIHFLREKADKETYARQLETVQEFLKVTPTTGDKVDVEEVLCRSILVNARRHLAMLFPGRDDDMFINLVASAVNELTRWRELGRVYYGLSADTDNVDGFIAELDRRIRS